MSEKIDIFDYCCNHTLDDLSKDTNNGRRYHKIAYKYSYINLNDMILMDAFPIVALYNKSGLVLSPVTVFKVLKNTDHVTGEKSITVYIKELKSDPKIVLSPCTDKEYNSDYFNRDNYLISYEGKYYFQSFECDENDEDDELVGSVENIATAIINTLNIDTLEKLYGIITESFENIKLSSDFKL